MYNMGFHRTKSLQMFVFIPVMISVVRAFQKFFLMAFQQSRVIRSFALLVGCNVLSKSVLKFPFFVRWCRSTSRLSCSMMDTSSFMARRLCQPESDSDGERSVALVPTHRLFCEPFWSVLHDTILFLLDSTHHQFITVCFTNYSTSLSRTSVHTMCWAKAFITLSDSTSLSIWLTWCNPIYPVGQKQSALFQLSRGLALQELLLQTCIRLQSHSETCPGQYL